MIKIYDWICTLNHLKICFSKRNDLAQMSHPISCTEPKLLPELLVSLTPVNLIKYIHYLLKPYPQTQHYYLTCN